MATTFDSTLVTFDSDSVTFDSDSILSASTKATELAQLSRKLTYNESTDIASINGQGAVLTVSNSTDDLQEGSTNLYFTTGRIDSHLSGGTGITYSNGAISFDASTAGIAGTDVSFDNTQSGYVASNVQSAIDELFDKKLNVTALNAAVVFYATDAASDIATYFKLVTSTDDADYDDTPVNIPTGTITADDQFIAALASAPGVFSGATGQINVNTIGNVRKTSGNKDGSFYFEVYIRDGSDNETLIGTSSTTDTVDNVTYQEFFADALIDSTAFTETDRVVLKFYGNQEGIGDDSAFEFQFGGTSPVRTNFPVPVTVVPHENDAGDILVDASGFSGILSTSDDDVQTALNTIDGILEDGNKDIDVNNATVRTDLTVQGDLTVSGTTTFIESQTLNIGDNIITLNSDVTGSPTENAGIEVERGTGTNVSLRWNEANDVWEITNDGSSFEAIATTQDIAAAAENDFVNSASYNIETSTLTLTRLSGDTVTADINIVDEATALAIALG